MTIKDIKDLQKVITLCRKLGVESIKVDNVEFHLGAAPIKTYLGQGLIKGIKESITTPTFIPGGITEDVQIPTDGLTEEQLLFYSATSNDLNEQQ